MSSEENRSANDASRPRPTRAQRIVAAGFLGAFSLTILTVLLTGLWVRAPDRRQGTQPPPVTAGTPNAAVEAAAPAAPAPLPRPEAQRESADGGDASHDPTNAAASEPKTPDEDGR